MSTMIERSSCLPRETKNTEPPPTDLPIIRQSKQGTSIRYFRLTDMILRTFGQQLEKGSCLWRKSSSSSYCLCSYHSNLPKRNASIANELHHSNSLILMQCFNFFFQYIKNRNSARLRINDKCGTDTRSSHVSQLTGSAHRSK